MSANGPADPFDTKPGLFKRLLGGQKEAQSEGVAAEEATDQADPEAPHTMIASSAPDTITVEGHTVEEVLSQLHALGITEIDEAALRATIGEKHPSEIKIMVERKRRTVVHERANANVVADDATVLTTGTPLDATVTGVSEVDPNSGTAGALHIGLSVHTPGQPDARVTVLTDPPPDQRHLIFPGATLPVRLDPRDPDRLGIDWSNAAGTPG